ncbi:MAG: hypothetical protein CM15mP120_30420 [Pseudomonadota bacterium]|nr:MAG: hypothetical protein CM15mP120_30420 [Pseudomonadota bacterium]
MNKLGVGMTTTARVVVLPQTGTELRVETVELPESRATTSVVKQFASGVCHCSCIKSIGSQKPSGAGHESTGVVTEVGSAVTHVAPW